MTALSTDAFVASFAYGTSKIKIPFSGSLLINLICTGLLLLSLLVGSLLRPLLPAHITHGICFGLLLLLGLTKLFDAAIKSYIRRRRTLHKQISFSALNINFILNIYADPEVADQDASKTLSPAEASSLALALSLDGLAVGFGAAMGAISLPTVALLSYLTGMAAVWFGSIAGNKFTDTFHCDLSWVGGALLVLLAFLKL